VPADFDAVGARSHAICMVDNVGRQPENTALDRVEQGERFRVDDCCLRLHKVGIISGGLLVCKFVELRVALQHITAGGQRQLLARHHPCRRLKFVKVVDVLRHQNFF
jgi:hypothetical protein